MRRFLLRYMPAAITFWEIVVLFSFLNLAWCACVEMRRWITEPPELEKRSYSSGFRSFANDLPEVMQ
jgi:hypothetical protein